MLKIVASLLDKNRISFLFWAMVGVLITVLCYSPFKQPILVDRAYLLYMSQVVSRGDALYQSTTFGYTPLSTIIVGLFMKIGSWFSLNTIASARITGLLLYGFICGSFFLLCKSLFKSKLSTLVGILFFCGMGYIQILSGINAEPKLWVLLFSILGIYFFNKTQWVLVGLAFTLAAMSWHVAVVSLFACTVMLPWGRKSLLSAFSKLALGVFIGTLPVIGYLLLTNGWLDFWNQAVIRKLLIEGEVIGESPLAWIFKGLYPHFLTEALHFLFAGAGVLLILYQLIKQRDLLTAHDKRQWVFLIVYSMFWSAFNALDFQTAVDLLPLIPAMVVFGTYFVSYVSLKAPFKIPTITLVIIILVYNLFDATIYDLPYSYKDQLQTIESIKHRYKKPFVMGFEEYYVIEESRMPTKFMRFAPYEDHIIAMEKFGCMGIQEFIVEKKYDGIILLDKSLRQRSSASNKLINRFKKTNKHVLYERGSCASDILRHLTDLEHEALISTRLQTVLLGNSFFTEEFYLLFDIRNK
jgi:hypothetical protein